MKHIAIIGFGIVGGGIPEVLDSCKDGIVSVVGEKINVKYILDLREFPDSPYKDRVVHDINVILNDPEIELVCETMGGAHPAYEFSIACMEHGISVVTSNKEVVATFGESLLECAAKNGVNYLFEASVGGGIPCLRPFITSLAHEKIVGVNGILNGTTNFILTKMRREGRDFADVLAEAQTLGYAEKNPAADVDGIDAMRKIIILTALSTGKLVTPNYVYAETISNVTTEDMDAAQRLGCVIRLVGSYKAVGDKMSVYACPQLVPASNPLYSVDDVYNAVCVTCDITGDLMFYGRGAGRYPTAGAVVADVVACLSGAASAEKICEFKCGDASVLPFDSVKFSYYIRTVGKSAADVFECAAAVCEEAKLLEGSADGKVELVCGKLSKTELTSLCSSLGNVQSVIRFL